MEKKPLNAENMGKGPRRPRFLVRLISRESISKLLYPKRVVSWSKSRKGDASIRIMTPEKLLGGSKAILLISTTATNSLFKKIFFLYSVYLEHKSKNWYLQLNSDLLHLVWGCGRQLFLEDRQISGCILLYTVHLGGRVSVCSEWLLNGFSFGVWTERARGQLVSHWALWSPSAREKSGVQHQKAWVFVVMHYLCQFPPF